MNKNDDFDDKEDREEFEKQCPKYPYMPSVMSARSRIIALGDLHGDYEITVESLKLANVIDKDLNWIGGDTVVVQVGDQIDRCRPYNLKCDHKDATINDEASDIKILKLFTKLDKMAMKDNGRVISLLGNHELMNVMGNLNYVSYKGLKQFENYVDPNDPSKTFESGKEGRRYAFAPGNEYGKFLACTRLSTVIIGSFLFVHAGIIPEFTKKQKIKNREGLLDINKNVRKWLLGLVNKDYVDQIVGSYSYSLFWDRILGNIPPNMSNKNPQCSKYLKPILELFKVDNMIIGHTPQFFKNNDGINSTCDNKLWRVDHGVSDAFLKFDPEYKKTGDVTDLRKIQILEIIDDSQINILK